MQSNIIAKGCRQHNLKNISVVIPKSEIVVFVGVSGSGKSSLVFDTIFAEGQRRYLEYLSPEIRKWIKLLPRPDADFIDGLSPCLAVSQHRGSISSRSTVATHTDIYDFLAVLFANIGEQHSPATGKILTRYSRQQIVDIILKEYPEGTKIQLIGPIRAGIESVSQTIQRLLHQGYIRLKVNGEDVNIEEGMEAIPEESALEVIVDRIEMKEGIRSRLSSSIDTVMELTRGILKVQEGRDGDVRFFTEIYVCPESGYAFPPLTPVDFNFNSFKGACPRCRGEGGELSVNPDEFIWQSHVPVEEQVSDYIDLLSRKRKELVRAIWNEFWGALNLPEGILIKDVSHDIMQAIKNGSKTPITIKLSFDDEIKQVKTAWKGLAAYINDEIKEKGDKSRCLSLDFVNWKICPECQGGRLKAESLACLIQEKGIHELCAMRVDQLKSFLAAIQFTGKEAVIAKELLAEVISRLDFLDQVGLGYLELNRQAKTLSEGEAQRVELAALIGAKLSGIIYILDEPSKGLHACDIDRLAKVIHKLKELGNSVLLVEHQKQMITLAKQIIELGPGAGNTGGELIFQGDFADLLKDDSSPTGQWLSGKKKLPKNKARKSFRKLSIKNLTFHYIHQLSLDLPLGVFVGLCGVSGSGKSTLAIDVIAQEIRLWINTGKYPNTLSGYDSIKRIIFSEQGGASIHSRSMPATYVEIMTPLRELFASTKLAKARGYTAARFSLNKRGGRCDACEGKGTVKIPMQFMADLEIPCELCQGSRYNYETLQVTWQGLSFADVLNLTVENAEKFFQNIPKIASKLEVMNELGLGYITLGQSFATLSGGEIQRLSLIADIASETSQHTLYILDEPSAGLHFNDVEKLVAILHRLTDAGHSVIAIEHNLDLLGQADWLIEMGPGGGPEGGKIVFEGTPAKLLKANTATGIALRKNQEVA